MITLFDRDVTLLAEHRYTLHEIVVGFGMPLWDSERPYPIFDESYRSTLNNRIYDHFEYRRIAADTPQMFVNFLNRRMREQMPAYNEIYKKLAAEDFDPYLTSEREDIGANTSQTESQTDSESNAKTSSLTTATTSNTPASYMENPYDPKYMSSLAQTKADSDADTTGSTSSTGTSKGDYGISSKGRAGYLGDAVLSSLATGFLNTDLMVCDMLEPLFMQLWNDQPL